jgi:hypothetical protein
MYALKGLPVIKGEEEPIKVFRETEEVPRGSGSKNYKFIRPDITIVNKDNVIPKFIIELKKAGGPKNMLEDHLD